MDPPTSSNLSIVEAQNTVRERPYSIKARLTLAHAYAQENYPDLAVGETYLALLLVDEATGDAGGEFEEEALSAAREDYAAEKDGEGNEGLWGGLREEM